MTAILAKARQGAIPSPERLVGRAAAELGLDWRNCSPADRIRLLHAVRVVARAWLRHEAKKTAAIIEGKALFGRARAAAGQFFDRSAKFIRASVLAGWLAIAGPGEPSQVALDALNRGVAEQHEYLANFQQEVMEEHKRLLPARAEQYGGSVWTVSQNAKRAEAIASGATYERRVHVGQDEPCVECAGQVALGWQPAGTLRALGDCLGGPACHCHFEYRTGKRWRIDAGKSFNPSQARDGHGRWTSAGGGRYRHSTAIAIGGTSASTHAATQRVNSGPAGPGASKRRYRKRKVRSDKHGEIVGRIGEHRRKVGQKLRRQRQQGAARRAKETARLERGHAAELSRIDQAHERRGTSGSPEHHAERGRAEAGHARERAAHAEAHRLDRDIERVEHRHEAAIARQHHRDTEAAYLRRRHERLTEGE